MAARRAALLLTLFASRASGGSWLFDVLSDESEASRINDETLKAELQADIDATPIGDYFWPTNGYGTEMAAAFTACGDAIGKSNGVVCPFLDVEDDTNATYAARNNITQRFNIGATASDEVRAPHVLIIWADDMGWNDWPTRSTWGSWATPSIAQLAAEGVTLERHYSESKCMPSRAAAMTGRAAARVGFWRGGNLELPASETTLAEEFKAAGYMTALVGKWHLGFSSRARWPTRRGFDSFYGAISGNQDYYTKASDSHMLDAFDLQDGEKPVADGTEQAEHAGELLSRKALAVVNSHDASRSGTHAPLFLWYSTTLVHSDYEAPAEYRARCGGFSRIPDTSNQAHYCGLLVMFDDAIGNITCAAHAKVKPV